MKCWIIYTAVAMQLTFQVPVMAGDNPLTPGDSGIAATGPSLYFVTFRQHAVVDGVRVEFEIMRLASMNMADDSGATHHVILKLFYAGTNQPIFNSSGKVKIIGPSGKKQAGMLKPFNGILGANFAFTKQGRYGLIFLLNEGDKEHLVKFWYPHG